MQVLQLRVCWVQGLGPGDQGERDLKGSRGSEIEGISRPEGPLNALYGFCQDFE